MEKKIIKDFENTFKKSVLNDEFNFRKEFLNKFIDKGFPSKKLESWKFSDLNQIINNNIENLNYYRDLKKSYQIDKSIYLNNIEHNSIVFVNGKMEEINLKHEDSKKFKIQKEIKKENNKIQDNALISLNNAFTMHNFKISVEDNYKVKNKATNYKKKIYHNITLCGSMSGSMKRPCANVSGTPFDVDTKSTSPSKIEWSPPS